MFSPLLGRALPVFAAIAALNVAAQTAAPAAPRSVPHIPYQSAFEGYQAYSDNELLDWKESNDTVGKIGGWRAYAREAQDAQPAPAKEPAGANAPATPVPAPAAANPHAGHGKR